MGLDDTTGNNDYDLIRQRILKLEERLDRIEKPFIPSSAAHPAWALMLSSTAVTFGILGMGVPRHPYQYLFAALLLLLVYHRRWLHPGGGIWRWPLVAVNYFNLGLFFLIVLGGGVRSPLTWFKSPAITKILPPDSTSWYGKMVPDYTLLWNEVPGLSDWSIDLTKIQAFFLIATMAGALFRFQGFSSITALLLLIISLPAYLSFTWDWVLLYLIVFGLSLYMQTLPEKPEHRTGIDGG